MIVSQEFEETKSPLSEDVPLMPASNQAVPDYSRTGVPHVYPIVPSIPVTPSSSRRRSLRTWMLVVVISLLAFAIFDSSYSDDSVVDWPDWPDWINDSDKYLPHRSTKPGCYNLNTNSSSRFQQIIYAPNVHTQDPSNPTTARRHSHAFHLPITADLLFFEANGSQFRGSLEFVTDDRVPKNVVKIDVVVTYHTQAALDRAQLCYLVEGKRQHGLGIYTRADAQSATSEQLLFDIVVRVPRPSTNTSSLYINAIRADMADFAIATDDLERDVFVRSIQMSTANADISIKSLRAENAFLSTSNGKITGVFNVTDSLGLMTSNAPINAIISMANTEHEPASQLYMSTSNAPILTTLHLHSSHHTDRLFPPSFIASAHTTNGDLSIRVPTQPDDATLIVRGTTSNAKAEVAVGKDFVGEFILGTSLAMARVVRGEEEGEVFPGDVGMGETVGEDLESRKVDVRRVGWGVIEGGIRCTAECEDVRMGSSRRSSVTLQTSLMPVILRLL